MTIYVNKAVNLPRQINRMSRHRVVRPWSINSLLDVTLKWERIMQMRYNINITLWHLYGCYVTGGLAAVIYTDTFQTVVMTIGAFTLIIIGTYYWKCCLIFYGFFSNHCSNHIYIYTDFVKTYFTFSICTLIIWIVYNILLVKISC